MTYNNNTLKIKVKIEQLLNECRTGKSITEFTHVSLGGVTFPGKFNISDKNKRIKLAKYLSIAAQDGLYFSIAEKLNTIGPIMVDIDFRIPKENSTLDERLYDMELIKTIILKYTTAIKKYLNVEKNELDCLVFEKNKPGEKNNEKSDGVHLIFPYLTVLDKVRYLIFKYVQDECIEEGIFNKYSNSSEVLDEKIVSTNPWLMYGCCKPGGIPYTLTNIYNSEMKLVDIKTLGTNQNITLLLSLRDSRWNVTNLSSYNDSIDIEYINKIFEEKNIDNIKSNDMLEDIIPGDKLELVEKATILTDMLANKRANNFHDWIRVGWALHNTHKCLIDCWVEFSKRSKKYITGECEKIWQSMKDDGYTIRSLMLWAKEDEPDKYKNFIKEDFENNLKKNTIQNTFMIAKALFSKYFDKFVCANPKDNIWYHFTEHRWRKCSNGGTLITLISSEFANHYLEIAQEFNKKAIESNGSDKKHFLDESKHFTKIADNLMDITFKEKIMKEAKHIFHDENFIKRLDENPNIIGFENGVYDLQLKKFRRGHPDDHISMSTRNNYVKWSENNPYALSIQSFFSQVLPNKNVRNYFLSRLSTCVSGENREEKFYFCTGSGSNGKSLTFDLTGHALGDYYISCPITIITRKRGASNAASPELARMKGPRCGVYQEPGNDEELNVGIFKELSGNDKFMVRGLYQDPIEVKPQLKSFMTMNEKPKISSDDGGTWRRLRVIDFGSKFVENPDPSNPNEFLLDETLKSKIPQWGSAFASYLIHIYTTLYDVPNKVPEPVEVQCSTNEYRKEQDLVREYYDTSIEVTENKSDLLKKKDLFAHFKLWFKEIHEGEPIPKNKKLYDFIEKEIKQKYGINGWPCVKFRDEHIETSINDLDV
jgi:P4 family phage/plasmid primase-like protien